MLFPTIFYSHAPEEAFKDLTAQRVSAQRSHVGLETFHSVGGETSGVLWYSLRDLVYIFLKINSPLDSFIKVIEAIIRTVNSVLNSVTDYVIACSLRVRLYAEDPLTMD